MGVDYYARAVIGCEVTGKLYQTVTKPRCQHPQTGGSFCSTCGASTAPVTEQVRIAAYHDDDTIGGLKVVSGTDQERSFVGVTVRASYDSEDSGRACTPRHGWGTTGGAVPAAFRTCYRRRRRLHDPRPGPHWDYD